MTHPEEPRRGVSKDLLKTYGEPCWNRSFETLRLSPELLRMSRLSRAI